jgi:hypothetical protein
MSKWAIVINNNWLLEIGCGMWQSFIHWCHFVIGNMDVSGNSLLLEMSLVTWMLVVIVCCWKPNVIGDMDVIGNILSFL